MAPKKIKSKRGKATKAKPSKAKTGKKGGKRGKASKTNPKRTTKAAKTKKPKKKVSKKMSKVANVTPTESVVIEVVPTPEASEKSLPVVNETPVQVESKVSLEAPVVTQEVFPVAPAKRESDGAFTNKMVDELVQGMTPIFKNVIDKTVERAHQVFTAPEPTHKDKTIQVPEKMQTPVMQTQAARQQPICYAIPKGTKVVISHMSQGMSANFPQMMTMPSAQAVQPIMHRGMIEVPVRPVMPMPTPQPEPMEISYVQQQRTIDVPLRPVPMPMPMRATQQPQPMQINPVQQQCTIDVPLRPVPMPMPMNNDAPQPVRMEIPSNTPVLVNTYTADQAGARPLDFKGLDLRLHGGQIIDGTPKMISIMEGNKMDLNTRMIQVPHGFSPQDIQLGQNVLEINMQPQEMITDFVPRSRRALSLRRAAPSKLDFTESKIFMRSTARAPRRTMRLDRGRQAIFLELPMMH